MCYFRRWCCCWCRCCVCVLDIRCVCASVDVVVFGDVDVVIVFGGVGCDVIVEVCFAGDVAYGIVVVIVWVVSCVCW